MDKPNLFEKENCDAIIKRIDQLDSQSKPLWGKMDVSKMLAHCNVTYEMMYTDKHSKPNFFLRLMLKWFIKPKVVGTSTYPKSAQTAPAFVINSDKNFEEEKERLIEHIRKTCSLGEGHFEGKESLSFGALNSNEWNNMMYKHLDHHLNQFGV